MIVRTPKSLAVSIVVLLIAVVFIVIGARRSFQVYEIKDDPTIDKTFQPPGFVAPKVLVATPVSEGQLVVDATFSGTKRDGDKLLSTYDRSKPQTGRRACPT